MVAFLTAVLELWALEAALLGSSKKTSGSKVVKDGKPVKPQVLSILGAVLLRDSGTISANSGTTCTPDSLATTLILVRKLALLYEHLPCVYAVLEPMLVAVKTIGMGHPVMMASTFEEEACHLLTLHDHTAVLLERICSEQKIQPRVDVLRNKVYVKKQFTPVFEDNYVLGKKYGQEAVVADRKSVKQEIKKETRSAVRELRKDAVFLQRLNKERKAENDEKLLDSQAKAKTFLQDQQSLTKELDINKHKEKMREQSKERKGRKSGAAKKKK